jgi:hypothetical protein
VAYVDVERNAYKFSVEESDLYVDGRGPLTLSLKKYE